MTDFAFDWPYLDPEHVVVLVDGVPRTRTFLNPNLVRVVDAYGMPVAGNELVILRVTPDTPSYANVKDSGNLTADQLNRLRLQLLYLIQETRAGTVADVAEGLNNSRIPIDSLNNDFKQIKDLIKKFLGPIEAIPKINDDIARIDNAAKAEVTRLTKEIQDRIAAGALFKQTIDDLAVQYAGNSAQIRQTNTALVDQQGALTAQIEQARSDFQTADGLMSASINDVKKTLGDADKALASRVASLEATVIAGGGYDDKAIRALINDEATARATKDQALTDQINTAQSLFETKDREVRTLITEQSKTFTDFQTSLATTISDIRASVKTAGDKATAASTLAQDISTAFAAEKKATADRFTSLQSTVATKDSEVRALIQTNAKTAADANTATAKSVTDLQASVDTKIANVKVTADSAVTRLGNVEASYTIKTQARSDGKLILAGITTVASTETKQSDIILMADRVSIAPTGNANGVLNPLFTTGMRNGVNQTIFPAQMFGDATIGANVLVDGAITARHMRLTGQGYNLWTDMNYQVPSEWRPAPWQNGTDFEQASDTGNGLWFWCRPGGEGVSKRGTYRVPVERGAIYKISMELYGTNDCDGFAYLRLDGANTRDAFDYTQLVVSSLLESVPVTGKSGWFTISAAWLADYSYVSPMVLLNYRGTRGNMSARNVRIEKMIDHTLVVDGGIKANKIDTRGLTVRKDDGTILLGAGTKLKAAEIDPDSSWLNGNIKVSPDGKLSGAGTDTHVANNSLLSGDFRRLKDPPGGFLTLNGSQQGCVVIKLPCPHRNTMVKMTVELFDYDGSNGNASLTYEIAFYTYNDAARFYSVSVNCTGNPNKVREVGLLESNGYTHVLIGAKPGQARNNPSFDYPKVLVSNVFLGYVNAADAEWTNNWSVYMDNGSYMGNCQKLITKPTPGGVLSGIDQIPDLGEDYTYIAQAAIKDGHIGTLNANKIVARTITTDKLVVNSVTTNVTSSTGYKIIDPSWAQEFTTGVMSLGQVPRTGGVCRKFYTVRFDAFNYDRYYTAMCIQISTGGNSWIYTIPFAGNSYDNNGRIGRLATTQVTFEVFDTFGRGSPGSPLYEEDTIVVTGYPVDWDNRGNMIKLTVRVAVDRLYQEFKL